MSIARTDRKVAKAKRAYPGEPPRDLPSLGALLGERQGGLPRRLMQVTQFAVAHPEEIAFGTVASIAAMADVQPSTLVRFAQALGYSGFSELQAVFRNQARRRWQSYEERLAALNEENAGADSPATLLHCFMRVSSLSIERAGDTLDLEALSAGVDLLGQAETIHLVAAGRSFPVVVYLAYALRNIGVRCELVEQVADAAPEQVGLIPEHDAMLAVSFAPYAPMTVECAALAARRKVPLLAITDSPFSPLAQSATVWLEVAEADHAGFRSLAATMSLATTLAVALARKRRGRPDV